MNGRKRLKEHLRASWVLVWHGVFLFGWVEWNTGVFGFPMFDPFPFPLLGTLLTIEAVFLLIIMARAQSHTNVVEETLAPLDLPPPPELPEIIGKLTKMLRMMDGLMHHLGVSKADRELRWMEHYTDVREIQKEIGKQNTAS